MKLQAQFKKPIKINWKRSANTSISPVFGITAFELLPKSMLQPCHFHCFLEKKTLQLFSTHSIIVEWENVCCPPLLNNLDTVFTFAMNFLGQNFRKEILRQKHSEKEICEEKKWTVDYVINSLYKILCRNACTILELLNFFSFFVDQIS